MVLAFKTRLGDINPQAEEGDYDYVIQQTISRFTSFLQERKMEYTVNSFPLHQNQQNAKYLIVYGLKQFQKLTI